MSNQKVSPRKEKLREVDIKPYINGVTKTKLLEYLSSLELPEEATFCLSAEEYYYGNYEVKAVFEYYTEETDEEYQARTRQESMREAQERMQYERLKAKFGGRDK